MSKKKMDLILLVLCILPLGFDKLYKGSVGMFALKFLLSFIGIGFIWWLFDLVCVIIGRYKVNPFA